MITPAIDFPTNSNVLNAGTDKADMSNKYTDLRSKIIAVTEQEYSFLSTIERKAYAEAAYFLMNDILISEDDIFAGKLEPCNLPDMYPESIAQEISYLKNTVHYQDHHFKSMIFAEKMGLFTRAPGAHVVPAYDQLVQEGIQERIDRVQRCMKNHWTDQKRKHFYKAEWIVLRAMQERILKYAESARKKYELSGSENIKRIYESCDRIAYNRPESFHEAMQLVILTHEHILAEGGSGSISFGRFDQYLYPYYQKDLEIGNITKDTAQKMIIAFWEKIAQYEMSWQNVTLGGCNQNGDDMCNDLTLFCLNASLMTRADQPQVSLRIHKNTPDNVWDKAFEVIRTGMGFPELYNDEVAVKAKMNAGISEEDAWNYSIVGCVELSAGGKEYSHTEGARFNWQKILELILFDGKCCMTGLPWQLSEKHSLSEIHNFQEFYEWYKKELVHFTKFTCHFIDILSKQYTDYWPMPFTSSMMQGCIETGKDITDCGTTYNNLTLNCVGIATVADSLEAIENLVFKENLLSLNDLSDILRKNFEGYEWVQKKLQSYPKYGNNILSVDSKVKDLTEVLTNTLSNMQMKYSGGNFQSGFYTSYFHATMGKLTGASSDGRKSGEALSSSLSPMAGMDINGPTAVINSANRINMEHFSNGMVLDLKFTSEFFSHKTHYQAVRILIEEYFDMGGMEIQFNILERSTLISAQKEPVKYRNLIVRVSGFSAYFVALEESLQNEIIHRTEHQIV